ncbi:MAG: bifunctional folylpolyglutamate synthase/dihydrofolate synthase [Eubacteriales bacterium]|nr:bifunctional folylpolyglutamate synthase/dihydrofolate synthase [Eubacteriales bacterium]MDD3199586.1 bifunctional folylpolyglutamate synthase/dihydrofolate synthase [Eubacteriales bacterium]MDD4121926.1 bifunctional folylpolyglutamate synthase/dihydrofolate synthase [Eubacteriales bacterium]MDD4629298.1 bifunctional folylpolyglutamate synthase/dihydrofolate synthase [Eubacteriales bacterium]
MTYNETLDRIHSFQRFGSRLGLERMSILMEYLGNPQDTMQVIHVGGTNGKGSVCRYLYSVLQKNGYRAGLYTSPYIERFTERIECNGCEISQEDLIRYTNQVLVKVDIMIENGLESPTEFELITAIAFLYFSEQNIDFLVLEVGLGGSGDSTNIVRNPVAAVITSISYDHMEYLGDTLEKIAVEKAGIIKPGITVICNVIDSSASAAIRRIADNKGSKLIDVQSMPFQVHKKTIDGYVFDTEVEGTEFKNVKISMLGMHQIENAICALTVIEILKKEGIIKTDKQMIYDGLAGARQTGRFELLRRDPYMIIDGAHNEAGADALATVTHELFPDSRILMVIGMLADKKIDRLLAKFGSITQDFVATEPNNPRKLSAVDLCKQIQAAGMEGIAIKKPKDACSHVKSLSDYDVIIFAGSLYLIGEVRVILNNEKE